MSDHIGEQEHLRERIATALRTNLSRSDTVHLKEHEALWAADAIIADLDLRVVGWFSTWPGTRLNKFNESWQLGPKAAGGIAIKAALSGGEPS